MVALPRMLPFGPLRHLRDAALALVLAVASLAAGSPAQASTGAESFVQSNVSRGLGILNNDALSPGQRKAQFESFLLGLTDMRRIANFTLGQYRRSATPQQQADFADAFQTYATAVYQTYFNRYSGQTLRVIGSTERAPGDTIVKTEMIDPKDNSGNQPLEVDFRVAGDGGHYQVIDFSVAGIWLALEERDQFSAFLGQHGGDIGALSQHLRELARTYR